MGYKNIWNYACGVLHYPFCYLIFSFTLTLLYTNFPSQVTFYYTEIACVCKKSTTFMLNLYVAIRKYVALCGLWTQWNMDGMELYYVDVHFALFIEENTHTLSVWLPPRPFFTTFMHACCYNQLYYCCLKCCCSTRSGWNSERERKK